MERRAESESARLEAGADKSWGTENAAGHRPDPHF